MQRPFEPLLGHHRVACSPLRPSTRTSEFGNRKRAMKTIRPGVCGSAQAPLKDTRPSVKASRIRLTAITWLVVAEIRRFGYGRVSNPRAESFVFFLSCKKVLPDGEFETASVLMEHTQDVKCVAWHPREEVIPRSFYGYFLNDWSRFLHPLHTTIRLNSTSKTLLMTGSVSPLLLDTHRPFGHWLGRLWAVI